MDDSTMLNVEEAVVEEPAIKEQTKFDALIDESLLTDQGGDMLNGHKEEQFSNIKKAFLDFPDGTAFEDIEKEVKKSEKRFKERVFKGLESFAQKKNGVWHERQFALPEGDYELFKGQLKGLAVLDKSGAPVLKTTAKHGTSVMVHAVPNSWYSSRTSIVNAEGHGIAWAAYNKTELETKNKEAKAALRPQKTAFEKAVSTFKTFMKHFDECDVDENKKLITDIEQDLATRAFVINNKSRISTGDNDAA